MYFAQIKTLSLKFKIQLYYEIFGLLRIKANKLEFYRFSILNMLQAKLNKIFIENLFFRNILLLKRIY